MQTQLRNMRRFVFVGLIMLCVCHDLQSFQLHIEDEGEALAEKKMMNYSCNSISSAVPPSLDRIREWLSSYEDTIIRCVLDRAKYPFNGPAYNSSIPPSPPFPGSLLHFMLSQTEKLHSKLGRYTSPDEIAFFPDDLEVPIAFAFTCPKTLHPVADKVNVSREIWNSYFGKLLPRFAAKGDDGNYGSTVVCDISCLQALSKRIHYGKYVAEAKFLGSPQEYTHLIQAKDSKAILAKITDVNAESNVMKRVQIKAKIYGQTITLNGTTLGQPGQQIDPSVVVELYENLVIPLTKQVELQYLLRRLD